MPDDPQAALAAAQAELARAAAEVARGDKRVLIDVRAQLDTPVVRDLRAALASQRLALSDVEQEMRQALWNVDTILTATRNMVAAALARAEATIAAGPPEA